MAAGEYVSVRSQADSEQAAPNLERRELEADHHGEHRELAVIYVGRGLDPELATQVAEQLMAHDALGALAELLKQRGRYAELFELQAAGYR